MTPPLGMSWRRGVWRALEGDPGRHDKKIDRASAPAGRPRRPSPIRNARGECLLLCSRRLDGPTRSSPPLVLWVASPRPLPPRGQIRRQKFGPRDSRDKQKESEGGLVPVEGNFLNFLDRNFEKSTSFSRDNFYNILHSLYANKCHALTNGLKETLVLHKYSRTDRQPTSLSTNTQRQHHHQR